MTLESLYSSEILPALLQNSRYCECVLWGGGGGGFGSGGKHRGVFASFRPGNHEKKKIPFSVLEGGLHNFPPLQSLGSFQLTPLLFLLGSLIPLNEPGLGKTKARRRVSLGAWQPLLPAEPHKGAGAAGKTKAWLSWGRGMHARPSSKIETQRDVFKD